MLIVILFLSDGFISGCYAKQTLITESFEDGGSLPGGWAIETLTAGNAVTFATSTTWPNGYAPYNGAYMVQFNSYSAIGGIMRLKMTAPVSTVNYTRVAVDFAWLESSGFPGINDNVAVQWSTDGVNWITAGEFPRYNTVQGWKIKSQVLPPGAWEQSHLYIAFLFTSAKGNNCYLDLSRITATGPALPATITVGAGTTSCSYPFSTYWMDGRTQMLYHADEILAAGGSPGMISKIGFNVFSYNPYLMNGFNVRMMNTTMTGISTWVTSGLSDCYSGTYTVPGVGWQEIALQTPFAYDGTNLLVEICFDNATYYYDSYVYGSASPGNCFYYYTDLPTASGCDLAIGSETPYRPDINFIVLPFLCPPADLSASAVENSAALTWTKPCADECFIYDDGSMENAWAFNPGFNRWMGNKFPVPDSYSGVLKSFDMQWWNNDLASYQNFQIDVFNMAGILMGSSQIFQVPIPAPTGYWTLPLDTDIPVAGPFYAMLHWNAFTGSTHWLGYDENGPNISLNLPYGYDGTSFTPWTTFAGGFNGVFCLRACAYDNGNKKLVKIPPEAKPQEAEVMKNIVASPGMVSSSIASHAEKPIYPGNETHAPLSASGLTGYNIYQNSGTTPVQFVPGPNILTADIVGLTPGTYTYGIRALYDLTSYGFPGQYGESTLEGPVSVDISNVPATRIVQNRYIAGGEAYCYDATQTITVAGNGAYFIVNGNGSATMIAGQKIIYRPDVLVLAGGYMHGYIAPTGPYCESISPAIAMAVADDEENTCISGQSFFKIYPNPTIGTFILELLSESEPGEIQVEIYAMMGDKILAKKLTRDSKHEFSLSGMPTGLYFLRVTSGYRTETVKVIKQ
jgi:hypothetical protein